MYTPMKPYMDIFALLRNLMACVKAGTASFLGYPVTLIASFLKTAISFPATNTRITCVYMASCSIALVGRVNNKPLALNSHMHNVENQYNCNLFMYKLLLLYKYR